MLAAETFLLTSLSALWALAVLNIGITLRLVARTGSLAGPARALDGAATELEIGALAPAFTATTLDGTSVTEANYRIGRFAFVFVSPSCSSCALAMRGLVRLAPLAKRSAAVQIVIVSEAAADETSRWLEAVAQTNQLDIDLPVLVSDAQFRNIYNPTGDSPYFCFIEEGHVRARSLLTEREWVSLRRSWEMGSRLPPWIGAGSS